jgi:hypothetical protein
LVGIIIFFISMSGLASANGSVTITLKSEKYNISKDNSGYDIIIMDRFSDRVITGDPMLPQRTFDVLLPQDVDMASLQLNIISTETQVLEGTYNIKPSPKWMPQISNENALQVTKNESTYASNTDYPESFVSLLPTSQMRKWMFVPVNFIPFQYNPVTKKLTLLENVEIEISYRMNESAPAMAAGLASDTTLDDVASSRFINYGQDSGWYTSTVKKEMQATPVSDYVIITTNDIEDCSDKLGDFISHKESLGYHVLVVTEDDFNGLTGQAPNHRAEKIRQWLKNNYISNGIKYVLLIGNPTPYENGEGDIPMKMCWPRLNAEDDYKETPTDYFYADLTGNWDINGNGYYGEWTDYTTSNGVDLAAEVYVGRIPVYGADYATLDNILQKIMNYETSSDIEWRKSALLPMSFSDVYTDGAYLGEQMKTNYLAASSYSYWRMYQHGASGSCSLDSAFSSEENLRGGTVVPNRWANNDFGIVTWWGHGNDQGAYVGYNTCMDGAIMLTSDAPNLDDDHPSHTYQCSCTNGYPESSDNLQYAILKNGGITTTAATRVSWYYVGQTNFVSSPSNSGMGYEYVKLLVQGKPAGDSLYLMKDTGVSNPEISELLMNFYDFNMNGDPSVTIANANHVPDKPSTPKGTESCVSNECHKYSTSTTDSDGDQVRYTFDWGDGTTTITDLVQTGESVTLCHGWSNEGTYQIKVKAVDSKGASSEWSDALIITIANWESGSTVPGATNWMAYTSNSIYVDVNTSAAGFNETPLYFTSLGGRSSHFDALGVSAIYSATATGFRIYLKSQSGVALTPTYANSREWYIQWLAVPKTSINAGFTPPGTTNWKAFGSDAIYLDIDTSAAGFAEAPLYFASLGGISNHFDARGINAICSATATGFRIYLKSQSGVALTPAYANSKWWHLQWLGVPKTSINAGFTPSGTTNWQAYGTNAIYVDVNASTAGFAATPFYIASLGGNNNHFDAQGIDAIYSATATGFRIYLKSATGATLTPAYANSNEWHVQWLGA